MAMFDKMRPVHLSHFRKAGYASAELGISAAEVLLQLYLLKYYNTVIGLSAGMVGIALAVAVVWDAVTDPIMGYVSDRTRFASGRRRSYFLPGAILGAICMYALFVPPAMESEWSKLIYLTVLYSLLNTAMTIIAIPHSAMSAELVFDRNERTSIYGYRLLFATIGLVLGTALPEAAQSYAGGSTITVESMRVAMLWLAPVLIGGGLVSYLSTHGLDRRAHGEGGGDSGLLAPMRVFLDTLRNKAFVWLLIAYGIAFVARTLNSSLALYYYEFRLLLPTSVTVNQILLPFFGILLFSIPAWVLLSHRLGKRWLAFGGVSGLGLMTCIAYPLFAPGDASGPLIAAVIGGILVGSVLLFDSMLADVIDHDELRTGQNREGAYFGVFRLITKAARVAGVAISGFALEAIGFQERAEVQSDAVGSSLAILFGPGVGSLFLIAALLFLAFPLHDAVHRRVQSALERRRLRRAGPSAGRSLLP